MQNSIRFCQGLEFFHMESVTRAPSLEYESDHFRVHFCLILLVQVGLLNVGGYYDSLLTLFDNMHTQGFLKFNARTLVVSAPTPAELLDKLEVSVDQDLSHPSRCISGQVMQPG